VTPIHTGKPNENKWGVNVTKIINKYNLIVAAIGLVAAVGSKNPAYAGSVEPGDWIAAPTGISLFAAYNFFENSNDYVPRNQAGITNGTRIQIDEPLARLVHWNEPIYGYETGEEVLIPYTTFPGSQKIGGAGLSKNNGFGDPTIAFFGWLYKNTRDGIYLGIANYLTLPLGAYKNTTAIQPGANRFEERLQIGFVAPLYGTPETTRVNFELTGDAYFFGNNTNAAGGSQTLRQAPAYDLNLWIPYVFYPAHDAYVAAGFEETFGGKVTLQDHQTGIVSNPLIGLQESLLQFAIGEFTSPTVFVSAVGGADVGRDGGAKLNAYFEFRIAKFF